MDFKIITSNFRKGFDVWMSNIVAFIAGNLLLYIIAFVVGFIVSYAGGSALIAGLQSGTMPTLGMNLVIPVIVVILAFLVLAPLYFSLYFMAIKGVRGEKVAIKDIFFGFRSKSVYIRSLIYLIIMAVVFIIIGIIGAVLSFIPLLGALVALIFALAVAILFYYTIYVYIMTPSEGVIYALKESFNVAKSNLLITAITIIIAVILTFIPLIAIFTTPLAYAFVASVLRELQPGLKDASEQ